MKEKKKKHEEEKEKERRGEGERKGEGGLKEGLGYNRKEEKRGGKKEKNFSLEGRVGVKAVADNKLSNIKHEVESL